LQYLPNLSESPPQTHVQSAYVHYTVYTPSPNDTKVYLRVSVDKFTPLNLLDALFQVYIVFVTKRCMLWSDLELLKPTREQSSNHIQVRAPRTNLLHTLRTVPARVLTSIASSAISANKDMVMGKRRPMQRSAPHKGKRRQRVSIFTAFVLNTSPLTVL
jgi:hypothetical protein